MPRWGVRRRGASALPTVYLLLAALATAVVLPSVLRPPPDQAQSSAELSPDAPPEDEAETIIQSLQQAASRTAGATGGPAETVPVTTPSTVVLPSRGRCFGDPPRQTESAYSPPCRAAFTGANGGRTYANVDPDEIRVSFWHALGMPAERGPITDAPPPGESPEHRTARVLQQYFNERYELYGRRLRLWATDGAPSSEAEYRAQAVAMAEEAKVFAAVHLESPFCSEIARRGLICFSGNPHQQSIYDRFAPAWWSYQMGFDKSDRMAAEYICKKLAGRPAEFADGAHAGQQRAIAVLTESVYINDFKSHTSITDTAREMCGAEVLGIDFDGADTASMALVMQRVRSEGITTVVLGTGILGAAYFMTDAEATRYRPEWVQINSYGLDFNDTTRLLPPAQLANFFGMSGWELPRPFADTDCYRAYKSIDPTGEPDNTFCRLLWVSLEHVANGIQEAGPNLTPESFRDGMYSMPLQEPVGPWAIGGGYGVGDHSFVDDLAEIWWDPNAVDPDGGEPGAWSHTADGRRWGPGELDDVTRVFREGVSGYRP
jgi:hypothetical protein